MSIKLIMHLLVGASLTAFIGVIVIMAVHCPWWMTTLAGIGLSDFCTAVFLGKPLFKTWATDAARLWCA